MKCNLTTAGTAIMLIVRGPDPWSGGQVVDQLVSNIDLYPTICEWAAIEPPAWVQGFSIEPLALDPSTPIRAEVFAEVTYHAAYEPMRSIRTVRWTYIHRYSERPYPVMPNCDEGESRDFLIASDWDRQPIDERQLYDNLFDPWNVANLYGHPDLEPIAAELAARLERWMVDTFDPLLHGDVPLPPGGLTNPIDGISPDGEILHRLDDGRLVPVANPGVPF
jgi:arylsulfatase A-like enzyme